MIVLIRSIASRLLTLGRTVASTFFIECLAELVRILAQKDVEMVFIYRDLYWKYIYMLLIVCDFLLFCVDPSTDDKEGVHSCGHCVELNARVALGQRTPQTVPQMSFNGIARIHDSLTPQWRLTQTK